MNSQTLPCSGSTFGLLIRHVRDGIWAQLERELAVSGHDLTFSQYVAIKKLASGIASVTDLARAAADTELDIAFIRASGPGGQNVNKLSTAAQ